MSITETQYFALLSAALWAEPLAIDEPIDWLAVMQLANRHATTVLICGVATCMKGGNKPSQEILVQMQAAMRGNLVKHLQLKQILVPAVRLLRQNGIEPVLLKGFGLAMLYPNPNLRQFGDLDVYVGLNKFHEACALLCTLPGGYNWGEVTDIGHHYNIEFGSLPLEVHRVSAEVADENEAVLYAAIERDGLVTNPQRVDFEGTEILIPSKEFVVFYTFFHAWHHFLTSGVGWRQLSDVAMALHSYLKSSAQRTAFDVDKLHRWITEMHLMQPWKVFGYLLVQNLGLPETEMPFYDVRCGKKAQRLYRRIMDEGNFNRDRSFKRNRPKRRLWQKFHTLICVFIDFFHLAKVFPDAAFREMRSSLKLGRKKIFQKK